MVEHRAASGSCARCRKALALASMKRAGVWYCSEACAGGRRPDSRPPAVPKTRLYSSPRRFFRARRPKELQTPGSGD